MASYDDYGDTPNQIKNEGQEITLTRTNTGGDNVLLSWNIPPAEAANCVPGRRAYDGVIVTASTSPFNISNAPVDGTVYTADPTVDSNLHMGDKIGTSVVIGAFYNDVTTITLELSGVDYNTPYYFSVFAVSKEKVYHTTGAHAYSISDKDIPNPDSNTQGFQQIYVGYQENRRPMDIINVSFTVSGILANDATGLDPNTNYTMSFKSDLCVEETPIEVHGSNAQTYLEMVTSVNEQIAQVGDHLYSNGKPNAGQYYIDTTPTPDKLYIFDGENNNEVEDIILFSTDPISPTTSTYWFDETTEILSRWNGASYDTQLWFNLYNTTTSVDFYWYNPDESLAYIEESSGWCPQTTFDTTYDPRFLDPADFGAGAYWYNSETGVLSNLTYKKGVTGPIDFTPPMDTSVFCWKTATAIYNELDPNSLPQGYYWFDTTEQKVYIRSGGSPQTWVEETTALIQAEEPTTTIPAMLWYDTTAMVLKYRALDNLSWELPPYVAFVTDPTIRDLCGLWWNSDTDQLFQWSNIDGVYSWNEVNYFVQQAYDPTTANPDFEVKAIWYDSSETVETNRLKVWDGTQWCPITDGFAIYNKDPINGLDVNVDHYRHDGIWYRANSIGINGTNDVITTDIITLESAAGVIPTGKYWIDTASNLLYQWNGSVWISLMFVTTDPTPVLGFMYFDTSDNVCYEWNGTTYVVATPCASLNISEDGDLFFTSPTYGCKSWALIVDNSMFEALTMTIRMLNPTKGTDGISTSPSYGELGIGDSGNTAPRKKLADDIKMLLGHPTVEVELTRKQLDHCIDLALQEIRRKSGLGYRRVFFFLELQPHKQIYELTDSCVGFNKVVDVMAAYRIQSSFLGNATGQGAYGQAMLQHLYSSGGFDLVSYHMVSEYVELMNTMFAAYLTFNWHEHSRRLSFYQTFGAYERVLLDSVVERTEQEIIEDRWTKTWIEKFASAQAKLVLSRTRGKFATLPGAGGGISLNAAELAAEAQTELLECEQEILDYVVDNPEDYGMESQFILG